MTAPQDPSPDALWATWRSLTQTFKTSRLIWHLCTSRAGMGVYGVDVLTGLRAMKATRLAMSELEDAPDALLQGLGELAALNARRNEALWRMAALFYVSVPVTLLLAGLEGAPDLVKQMLQDTAPALIVGGGMMTLWLLYYFANQWRARQIEAVIELVRIERAAAPILSVGGGRHV
jgi:hypothetical protein